MNLKLSKDQVLWTKRRSLQDPLINDFSIVRASLRFACVLHRPTFFSGIFAACHYMIFACVKLSDILNRRF